MVISGCGGGGGGGTSGGGGGTITQRDASIRAAQGFLAFDRIVPSQNWIANPDAPLRSGVQSKRGLLHFVTLACDSSNRGTPPPSDFIQEFDLGLWYKATILSSISTRFDLREIPTNPSTGAGSITVTRTSIPNAPPIFEVNLDITKGNYPMAGVLRFSYSSETRSDGNLFADYSLSAGSSPIRVQYNGNFDFLSTDSPLYSGIFTVTRGSVVLTLSNIENVNAFSRIIADFNASGLTGTVTQETIDGSFTVFLQGTVSGQDWVITVDGNGLATITPPNLPAEAPVSLLTL